MYALLNDTALVVVQRFWWDRVTRPLVSLMSIRALSHKGLIRRTGSAGMWIKPRYC